MHYRNRQKIILVATTIAAAALSGCATPQHTNLLIFGTNTQLGIKVGADATQTPAIQVGYNRQELVLMPLLANTGGTGDKLAPCPVTTTPPPTVPTNCKFTGNAGNNLDAYSVLASFGTKYDVSAGAGPKAGGGIAQYFATGLAARELATHGSSLVAATPAAEREAIAGSPQARALIQSRLAAAQTAQVQINDVRAALGAKVLAAGDNYKNLLQAFDGAISPAGGSRTDFVEACAGLDRNACASVVLSGDQLDDLRLADWQKASAVGG